MQPKVTEIKLLQNMVVEKVTKLVNMPPQCFMDYIKHDDNDNDDVEEDDEDNDEDGKDDDDYYDYVDDDDYGKTQDVTETRQESIQHLIDIKKTKSDHDDCSTSTTSGYISTSVVASSEVTEANTEVSLRDIAITDTDTLFVSDTEDNLSNISTNDEVIDANNFVSDDNDGISENIETELSLNEYTWEVECTKEFWKSFTKLAQPHALKLQALRKIARLARGEWRHFRTVKTTKSHGLHLFYFNLTAQLRIIWQLAISYSPKRTAKYRSECLCGKTDVIYSQVIRVWRIVDIKKMKKCIKLIQDSVNTEKICNPAIGTKNLKVLHMASDNQLPMLYCSTDAVSNDCIPIYFPADHKNTPLLLYKMDNALLFNKHSQSDVLDINYVLKEGLLDQKLSPEENDIIGMGPNKSIILLGRSGTGKTICCLHRLWKQFFDYWIERIQDTKEVIASQSHLRQAFITKSNILCNRFKKQFYHFLSGRKDLWQHFQCFQDVKKAEQIKIQEFHPYTFPLFITSHKWLLLLDASLEEQSFFKYDEDGSLLTNIIESESIEGSFEDFELFDIDCNISSPSSQKKKMNWRKVDSLFFINEMWPKFKSRNSKVDPILIWMEIHSFIKGSFKALSTKDGWLTKEDYINFGAKMAPNFRDDREYIYECFKEYQTVKTRRGYFDDNDLVHNLYHRLLKMDRKEALIHRLYVDEVQDFTQAELALLLLCSHIPYGQFLTGDTAQNIMRSVAFRFCDLRSIFHDFQENLDRRIEVPEICTLTQNFRSHSGVLQLASSVIDLLMNFFSSSLDKLPVDQGMFPGPKPVLVSSCRYSDLSQLVSVSREESVAIEFGARQVIIVRSEEIKDKLPDKLKVGIVLTVSEAKGLEFDDVLLYNFFADSEVSTHV